MKVIGVLNTKGGYDKITIAYTHAQRSRLFILKSKDYWNTSK